MHLPSEGDPDSNPHRKPDDWAKTFAEGEFVDFIPPLVETLDLYHNQTVAPRAIAQPKTTIEKIETQGDTTISESNSGISKYDIRESKFTGGFAETVHGDQLGSIQYSRTFPEKQDLAGAAADIQRLLQQLEENNPTATEIEKQTFISMGIGPTKKQRLINTVKSGGKATIEEFLDNPYVNVAIAIIEG